MQRAKRQVLQLMRDIFFSSRQTEHDKQKKKKREENRNYIYMFCVASAERLSIDECMNYTVVRSQGLFKRRTEKTETNKMNEMRE